MFNKQVQEIVWCPVGKHIELGYRTKGKPGTYVCRECDFIFPIEADGKVGVPIRIKDAKRRAQIFRYCGPDGCICRD
jgi:uncharacterized protein YbaR (Trm112 family)